MKSIALSLLAAFGLAVPCPAYADQWAWFVASSKANAWRTETGTAEVALSGRTFHAKLFLGNYLRHEIRGRIDGENLEAYLTTNESDQVDYPLQGLHKRTLWKDAAEGSRFVGRETIELTGAGLVVGFTREIERSPTPPKR